MNDALPSAGNVSARRWILVIASVAALSAAAGGWASYRHAHPSLDAAWRTRIFPDDDEKLTLRRADGQEFNVDLTGVRRRDGTVVPYDIALLSESDPPMTVFFEDVHYVGDSGTSCELIVIDDAQHAAGAEQGAGDSLGPGAQRIRSTGKYLILTDRSGDAEFGKSESFVPPLAGGGTITKIEIVTPYSLVRRVRDAPVESPF